MKAATQEAARVALYARVSTREGKQHLQNQLHQLTEYARRMSWETAAEFTDQDSGVKRKRPGLEAMLEAAARRHFDIVLVFDLSRLTRGGPAQAFEYITRLSASKVQFWSMQEEMFRTAGPAGEVFLALAAHIAQQERALQNARVRAGLDRARQAGTQLGRPRKLIDIDKARALHREGNSIRAIAATLKVSKGAVWGAVKTADKAKA